jgi:hypothetical protein
MQKPFDNTMSELRLLQNIFLCPLKKQLPNTKKQASGIQKFTHNFYSSKSIYFQTAMLLLTTTEYVQGQTLSRCLVLCFRLHQSPDFQVNHTASAILRQAVCTVFDRIKTPTPPANGLVFQSNSMENAKVDELSPFAKDGFALFQDLCLFANGDEALWERFKKSRY